MRSQHAWGGGALVVAALAWGWLTVGVAAAREAAGAVDGAAVLHAGDGGPDVPVTPRSLEHLARLSWPELEQLYRQAEARPIPAGYARGRAIYCSGRPLSGPRSALTGLLWHGKVFDAASCSLVNQWLGFRAVKARLYFGPSWLDGQPALVMDYRGTSRVWADVRDEVREVAPGLFLGAMFRCKSAGPKFQMFFALEAAPPG
jgi:hypothetical protein